MYQVPVHQMYIQDQDQISGATYISDVVFYIVIHPEEYSEDRNTIDLRIATFWQRLGWTFIFRRVDGFKMVWWSTEISIPTLMAFDI